MNGNGVVDFDDLNQARNHFGLNFTVWPGGGGALLASSGSGGLVLSDAQRYELFVTSLAELYATDTKQPRSAADDLFWASLQTDEIWIDVLERIEAK